VAIHRQCRLWVGSGHQLASGKRTLAQPPRGGFPERQLWVVLCRSSEAARTDFMDAEPLFENVRRALLGAELGHIWRGHGSALFLEFGQLRPGKQRRDGTSGNPVGELTLMIEWSWRVEAATSIVCGSWSDEELWPRTFDRLIGARVSDVQLFGRLPEISVGLTNGMFVASFMTAEGDPEWAILDRRGPGPSTSTSVRVGRLQVEEEGSTERVG
jgi:hypothetical protein